MWEVKKYVKRPVTVHAMQYDGSFESARGIAWWAGDTVRAGIRSGKSFLVIQTLESHSAPLEASPGDYIIRGVAGEFYPCREDIFHQTYEEATE